MAKNKSGCRNEAAEKFMEGCMEQGCDTVTAVKAWDLLM